MKNRRKWMLAAALAGTMAMTVEAMAGYGPGFESSTTTITTSYGPGVESSNVIVFDGSVANNPAYNNGWTGGIGPGDVGSNPLASNREDLVDRIYAGGPNSEAAQQYLAEEESIYIYNTYRGGYWEQQEDGTWKLYQENGQPVSSQWAILDGKTYLIDMYGIMQTGWQKVNDNWYYFNSVGAMQTGWLLKDNKYYFLNADGSMAYGWVNSMDKWYYFDLYSGAMVTNAYTADGRYVNAEGVLVE